MWDVKSKALLLLFVVKAVISQSTDDTWLLNIPQGPIRGHKDPGGGLYAFYNIPYATAPTGTDRFKAPLPAPTWTNIFDAVQRGITCPQPTPFPNRQEDCLVANVFVPDTDVTDLTVLVYIHGGAYQYGSGNTATLNALVRSNKLIVVTFNYRLGAHGFLCLGTEGAPGNAGLKDQVALLRWVKSNIANFGGNPDDVTIFGCSAGGGSTDTLTLSKTTRGLFNKAIIDSGVSFGAVGPQQEPVANAQAYARLLNFTNVHDLAALEEFYTTISYDVLYSQHEAVTGNPDSAIVFAPCVERDVGQERILEDAPINIIKNGEYNKVPLLYGFANMEGLMRINLFPSWKIQMNENFADFVPAELHFESEEEKNKVADSLKEFYFGDQPVSEDTILGYIAYLTDVLFGYPMLRALSARKESLDDVIYLYEYSFVDENSPTILNTNLTGADHCDQTEAIVDENKNDLTIEYIRMKGIMREYWLNFILTGSPWVEGSQLEQWPPANTNRTPHMSLGPTVQVKGILLEERAALWDDIYAKHYRAPRPPTDSAVSFLISKVMLTCTIFLIYTLS
ncbi:para-nitrobenzyl esterase-like [Anticarsia gemmatalis]|uniref:para-nitrobenzyl esterase-like n=1 Tax=Anticarsia gemmatalis TaxID=129554 RepID=UPI003F774168